MQNSPRYREMEDLETTDRKSPKLNRMKLPKRARNLSKSQLLEALARKKECNAKALAIVNRNIEDNITKEEFLASLVDINQCHYEDIVIERALDKTCGYPLCCERLSSIPKQKYHISIVTNKIYDLTDRKNFCSAKCFKSSNYIKEQMLTSPLWLRDQEDVPEFKLLSLN